MIKTDLNITPKDSTMIHTKYYYDKRNNKEMRNIVSNEIESIPQTDNIDAIWEWLTNTLNKTNDKFIPQKELSERQNPGKKGHSKHHYENTIRKIRNKT